jgi:asparagine synthetase B (glutamine-hydrolysing)
MKGALQNAGSLFGVIALQRAQGFEGHCLDKFLPLEEREGWRIESVSDRGFIAATLDSQSDSSNGARPVSSPDSTHASFFKDRGGFVVARGFVYQESNEEASPSRCREDEIAGCIAAAYRRHGRSFTAKIEGQFCAAGYDTAQDVFWIAVDTFGCSRLFYVEQDGCVLFSDEVLTLASRSGFEPRPCERSIHAYFTLFHVPPPYTGFAGIRQLSANSLLAIEGGKLTMQTGVWLPCCAAMRMNEDEAAEALHAILERRIKLILARNSSPALLFSGGVDSSLVGAILAANCAPNETAAHALGERGSDELRIAGERAELLGLGFRAWPWPGQSALNAETVTRKWQLPVFPFPAVYIDWFASEAAKVSPDLVSGSGADGIFLGDEILLGLLREIDSAGDSKRASSAALRQAARAARLFRRPKHFARRFLYSDDFNRAAAFFAPESIVVRAYLENGESGAACGLIFQYLAFAHHSIVSMYARAVEGVGAVHFPFVCKSVIEFALTLPRRLMIGDGSGKPLLKRLLQRNAPAFPVSESKRGFGHSISIERWLRPELMREMEREVLSSGLCDSGILRADAVCAIFDACSTMPRDQSLLHLAWGIHSLAVWFRLFITEAKRPKGGSTVSSALAEEPRAQRGK